MAVHPLRHRLNWMVRLTDDPRRKPMPTSYQAPPDNRRILTLTIPQAAHLLGISVSKAYAAARSGQLPTLRVGSRVLISRRRLEELVDGPVRGHAYAGDDRNHYRGQWDPPYTENARRG
jgi:excisionase family DNA binding protein